MKAIRFALTVFLVGIIFFPGCGDSLSENTFVANEEPAVSTEPPVTAVSPLETEPVSEKDNNSAKAEDKKSTVVDNTHLPISPLKQVSPEMAAIHYDFFFGNEYLFVGDRLSIDTSNENQIEYQEETGILTCTKLGGKATEIHIQSGDITCWKWAGDKVYCVMGKKQIIRMNLNGTDKELVYEEESSEMAITELHCSSFWSTYYYTKAEFDKTDLIYFVTESKNEERAEIFRLLIGTDRVERVLTIKSKTFVYKEFKNDIYDYYLWPSTSAILTRFSPYSNQHIIWTEINNGDQHGRGAYQQRFIYHLFNVQTGREVPMNQLFIVSIANECFDGNLMLSFYLV